MSLSRTVPLAVLAAVACALPGAPAQAAQTTEPATISGKAETRHGVVRLKFTTDPGWMVLRFDKRGGRHARGKVIAVQCRPETGSYKTVASVLWTSDHTISGGPAALPPKAAVCRIRRGTAVWATMRMRQTRDAD